MPDCDRFRWLFERVIPSLEIKYDARCVSAHADPDTLALCFELKPIPVRSLVLNFGFEFP